MMYKFIESGLKRTVKRKARVLSTSFHLPGPLHVDTYHVGPMQVRLTPSGCTVELKIDRFVHPTVHEEIYYEEVFSNGRL